MIEIICNKGTKAICPNCGDLIAVVNSDIIPHTIIRSSQFNFTEGQKCISGDTMQCKKCNSWYIRNGSIFTEKGWLPRKPIFY